MFNGLFLRKMKKNVVLIGASGFVGSAILKEMLDRGHRVTAVVRRPEKIVVEHPNLTVVGADAADPETLAAIARGKDAVISAYNPGWGNPRQYEETLSNYPKIVEGEFYLGTLAGEKEIDWVFFSPAGNLGNMGPGVRTGKYRLGKDDMLFDEKGESFISVEDYAVAMVDELEQENHHYERFTAAY